MDTSDSTSQLRFYSLGIVLKDNSEGGDYIEVSPIEHLSTSQGVLKNNVETKQSKIPNNLGVIKMSTVNKTSKIMAKWISFASNRIVAPCVYEGETVMLLTFSDATEKYWTTMFREPLLRRQELINIACSNLKEKGKEFDKQSSYWFEMNTIDKILQLHTSVNDNEPIGYDITIDTSKGTLSINDTAGNTITLNSSEGILKLTANIIEINAKNNLKLTSDDITITGDIKADSHMSITKGIDSPSNITAPNID